MRLALLRTFQVRIARPRCHLTACGLYAVAWAISSFERPCAASSTMSRSASSRCPGTAMSSGTCTSVSAPAGTPAAGSDEPAADTAAAPVSDAARDGALDQAWAQQAPSSVATTEARPKIDASSALVSRE
ncbi:hypothetical protein PSET11_01149 [Arthrobacter ulcerisalmonis]|uniref:Uncharacterized protein n=1 Tax=Arthrobacter ulcerisalmonis TaxID=2483813 RepID=A0A3P5WV70_9MICC|nr:hypothetical protein PSET11_01149 [Arthrobacter ulcerisalmonis]